MTAAASIDISTPDDYSNLVAALTHDRTALARMFKGPLPGIRFARHITFTTDDNTASASSPIINLTDLGVAFDANMECEIYLDVLAANGANRFRFQTVQRVLGSATAPATKGIQKFLTDCECSYGFTTSDGTTTTEDATSCIGPEWWDGSSPVAGNVSSNAITIQWLGGNFAAGLILPGSVNNFDAAAAAADSRVYQHGNVSLTNGTSDIFVSDVATPTAANWSNGSVVRARAKVYPPIECIVLVDTSPTPDKVFVGAKGLASDLVTWDVDVYVTDQRRMPLL